MARNGILRRHGPGQNGVVRVGTRPGPEEIPGDPMLYWVCKQLQLARGPDLLGIGQLAESESKTWMVRSRGLRSILVT